VLGNLGGFFWGDVVLLVKPLRCWEILEVAVVLSSRWLNLQGVGNLGGCCGDVVLLFKPSRCWETLEVFFGVMWSCWLNLQGVGNLGDCRGGYLEQDLLDFGMERELFI